MFQKRPQGIHPGTLFVNLCNQLSNRHLLFKMFFLFLKCVFEDAKSRRQNKGWSTCVALNWLTLSFRKILASFRLIQFCASPRSTRKSDESEHAILNFALFFQSL